MLYSWLQAAQIFNFHLHISTPKGYDMDMSLVSADPSQYTLFDNPSDACAGVDLVNTDVWTSMGYEAENQARLQAFDGWIVDEEKWRAPMRMRCSCIVCLLIAAKKFQLA
jgi:ornithine carbamoyltransferase